jgi:AAHS family benzoate transporter-like MFS transporter
MSVFTRPAVGPRRTPTAGGLWPVALCWLAVALDGFDLVVIGAVIPTISKSGDLGFTDASLTTASTMGLVGVGIGAVLIGPVTDRLGRRVTLISCIAWFSVLTIAVAFAPNVGTFVTLRLLAGLGLGACLPIALTFMSEHSPAHRNGTAMTRVMTGYHVGAVLTALLALWVIDAWGWEAMFVIGGIAGLLVLPFMWANLPESETFLEVRKEKPTGRMTDVLKGGYLRVSLGLWVASFMGLLLVYGLNTWLPKMMGDAGYSIKAGTGLLLLLNLGAVIGLLVAGTISDARGNKPTVLAWFGMAALFLALLSIKMQNEYLVYAAVLLTGIFVFSAQVLVYAFVGHLYPPQIRGTALGLAAGIGRVGAIVGRRSPVRS